MLFIYVWLVYMVNLNEHTSLCTNVQQRFGSWQWMAVAMQVRTPAVPQPSVSRKALAIWLHQPGALLLFKIAFSKPWNTMNTLFYHHIWFGFHDYVMNIIQQSLLNIRQIRKGLKSQRHSGNDYLTHLPMENRSNPNIATYDIIFTTKSKLDYYA